METRVGRPLPLLRSLDHHRHIAFEAEAAEGYGAIGARIAVELATLLVADYYDLGADLDLQRVAVRRCGNSRQLYFLGLSLPVDSRAPFQAAEVKRVIDVIRQASLVDNPSTWRVRLMSPRF